MQKNSFLIYHEYREHLKLLTDEQRGQLLMALIDYSEEGEIPVLDGITQMAFSFIRSQMDRDNEKYESRVAANRENGKKGGRPKKPKGNGENPKNPSVFHKTESNPKNPIKSNDKDNVKEKDINTLCKADANALFERLWKAYPNKRGKGQVSDAKKRKIAEIGEEEMQRAMARYIEELKQEPWKKTQNGSTFFNSGYIDYLDENYEKPAVIAQKPTNNQFHNFEERDYNYDELENRLFERQMGG